MGIIYNIIFIMKNVYLKTAVDYKLKGIKFHESGNIEQALIFYKKAIQEFDIAKSNSKSLEEYNGIENAVSDIISRQKIIHTKNPTQAKSIIAKINLNCK